MLYYLTLLSIIIVTFFGNINIYAQNKKMTHGQKIRRIKIKGRIHTYGDRYILKEKDDKKDTYYILLETSVLDKLVKKLQPLKIYSVRGKLHYFQNGQYLFLTKYKLAKMVTKNQKNRKVKKLRLAKKKYKKAAKKLNRKKNRKRNLKKRKKILVKATKAKLKNYKMKKKGKRVTKERNIKKNRKRSLKNRKKAITNNSKNKQNKKKNLVKRKKRGSSSSIKKKIMTAFINGKIKLNSYKAAGELESFRAKLKKGRPFRIDFVSKLSKNNKITKAMLTIELSNSSRKVYTSKIKRYLHAIKKLRKKQQCSEVISYYISKNGFSKPALEYMQKNNIYYLKTDFFK